MLTLVAIKGEIMAADQIIRAKIHRLEELRKYQAYYGPNTPYPVVVEINDLEQEIRQLLAARQAQAAQKAKRKTTKARQKPSAPVWQFWRMSRATFDAIVAIAFVGFLFLLATIIFAAYVNTRPGPVEFAGIGGPLEAVPPTLRPTFTPTVAGEPAADSVVTEASLVTEVLLPPAEREPTPVPTLVPSLTPTASPPASPTPLPTETPLPTNTPVPPAAPAVSAAPAAAAPPPPTVPPAPAFPFAVTEQGNREFQRTTYHVITVYLAVVSEGNIPLGGYKVIANSSAGGYVESGLSDWNWSVTNCLDCGYIKQGNLKIELGTFGDVAWSLYVADPDGNPLSAPVTLHYAAAPEQWVWDFVIFRRLSG